MAAGVSYQLSIDGQPASSDLLAAIRRIDVEDHAEMADMLRLTIAISVKANGSGWTIVDDGLFNRLVPIKLSLTVGTGNAVPLIQAYVIDTDARFSNDPNGSVLLVTAMDATVLMHLEEKVKAWPNLSDSDVASSIFSDHNFTPVVEATNLTHQEADHTLMQRGTDIQFLMSLAERNGYECYVELNQGSGQVEGHFHPPRHTQQSQGVLTVNMGTATNVNRFRSRYDMLSATTADATTINIEDGTDQQGTSQQSSLRDLGRDATAAAQSPRQIHPARLAMGSSAEVQAYTQALVNRASWSLTGEGDLNTVAYGGVLQAKRPVLVRGTGQNVSGTWYVQRVLLSISSDGSSTQQFTLRRNATGLTGQENFQSNTALPL